MWDWEVPHAGRGSSLLSSAGVHHLPGGGHVERRPGNELEAELRLWPDRQGERWGEGSKAGSPLDIRNQHRSNYRSGRLRVVAVTWSQRAAVSCPQASFVPGADTVRLDLGLIPTVHRKGSQVLQSNILEPRTTQPSPQTPGRGPQGSGASSPPCSSTSAALGPSGLPRHAHLPLSGCFFPQITSHRALHLQLRSSFWPCPWQGPP